jgi:hypothetical protein
MRKIMGENRQIMIFCMVKIAVDVMRIVMNVLITLATVVMLGNRQGIALG